MPASICNLKSHMICGKKKKQCCEPKFKHFPTFTMNSEAANPGNQRQMDQGLREMVSALTQRLTSLQQVQNNNKPPAGSHHKLDHNHEEEEEDDGSVQIITLAGNNTGATLKGDLEEDKQAPQQLEDENGLSTFVNSNFQAINNSIMIGGSYHTNDPGVRVEIIDHIVDHNGDEKKHEKKVKKKEASKSNQNQQHSD